MLWYIINNYFYIFHGFRWEMIIVEKINIYTLLRQQFHKV